MHDTETLSEAKRLYDLGFAIHWLRPKSKVPLEAGWTTGPRKTWDELRKTFRSGYNVGVRLGTPSRLGDGFLAVVDVDVKSDEPRHVKEAISQAKAALGGNGLSPVVKSGRGGGSRHYYFKCETPFKTFNFNQSHEKVRYFSPSKNPSKYDRKELSEEDIAKGYRIGPAWEVSMYSDGRQVVLPPSIHPDTGSPYRWSRNFVKGTEIPLIRVRSASNGGSDDKDTERVTPFDFTIKEVELDWLPISKKILKGIKESVSDDRSTFLWIASKALYNAGLDRDEILSVLTDPKNGISECPYDHTKSKDRKRAAMWVDRYTSGKAAKERDAEKNYLAETPIEEGRKLSALEQEKQAQAMEGEINWQSGIKRNQQNQPLKLINNVILILSNEVAPDVVRRDEFAYRDTYSVDTPWGGKKGKPVEDGDVDVIQSWLGKKYGFEPSRNIVESALVVMARENRFDPVKDWLDSLDPWDGKPRLDTWLRDHFAAKGDPEYLAQVFRKWMVALVMRVYEPGAKFDWMIIFEGEQEIGKSSFGEILVGSEYFLDYLANLAEKDSALALQGKWGVEMAELSQLKRNEIETVKSFLSRTVDKFRPPYGKRMIESPRRCVFFGSTNRRTYLIDDTGNRRFKPVEVGKLDFAAILKDRNQLFAEAIHLFKTKKETERTLGLTGAARHFEQKIHGRKMVEDDSNTMEESMRDLIEKVENGEVNFDLEKFRLSDLFGGAGCLGGWRKDNRNFQFAAKMLHRMGATYTRKKGVRWWKMGRKPV